MRRFLGGTDATKMVQRLDSLYQKSIIPIIDYAKEGARNVTDVLLYRQEIQNLIPLVDKAYSSQEVGYACKISSYLPYLPQTHIKEFVNWIASSSHAKKYIFFDAEQSALKQHEDRIFHKLIECSSDYDDTILFKTYQMYRKDSLKELEKDIAHFPPYGIKLVRGAYHSKRDDLLYKQKKETDENYNHAISLLLTNPDLKNQVCIATHNKQSIHYALSFKLGNHVSFAQLLGMGDPLTEELLLKNKKVFKYVPYGNLKETGPYLIRRFYENFGMLQHM